MTPNLPDDDEPIVEGLERNAPGSPSPIPPEGKGPPAQGTKQGQAPSPGKTGPVSRAFPESPDETARSAPRGSGFAEPGTSPGQQSEPADQDRPWGFVGRTSWGELTGEAGEQGMVRIVEAGVVYLRPPPEAGLRQWQETPSNPQRFEMPWPADPSRFPSLAQLAHDLGRNPPHDRDDPRLRELDEAVQRLLEITGRLHEHGSSLGLLHPQTILIVPGSGARDLVLPDYGFVWKGGPFRPAWLDREDYKILCDRDPESRQVVSRPAGEKGSLDCASDLCCLARLFAFVLTGTPMREVPDQPPALSRHQTHNLPAVHQVWEALDQASRGAFQTAGEFAQRLRKESAEPSCLCRAAAPRGLSNPGNAGGTPANIAGANGAVRTPFQMLREKFLAARPEDRAALLRQLYEDSVLSMKPELRRKEEAERERLRKDFLHANWLPRFEQAEQLLGKDLSQRFVCGKQLRALQGEMLLLQEKPPADQALDVEEKQCVVFSGMRVRELGSAP
jgi:hypothetical protein